MKHIEFVLRHTPIPYGFAMCLSNESRIRVSNALQSTIKLNDMIHLVEVAHLITKCRFICFVNLFHFSYMSVNETHSALFT